MRRSGRVRAMTPKVQAQQNGEKKKSGRAKFRNKMGTSNDDGSIVEMNAAADGSAIASSIDNFEFTFEKWEEKNNERKMRNIELRREVTQRDKIKKYLEETNEELSEKYELYFEYFKIDSRDFWKLLKTYDLFQYKVEDLKTDMDDMFRLIKASYNMQMVMSRLCILATVDKYREEILKYLNWSELLSIYNVGNTLVEEQLDPFIVLLSNLLATLASFPDSHLTLFHHRVERIVLAYLTEVSNEDTYKFEVTKQHQLSCLRIIARLSSNDLYQCNDEFRVVLKSISDCIGRESLAFHIPTSKKKFDKNSFSYELVHCCANILANLSSLDSFNGIPRGSTQTIEQIILLSHYQNSEYLALHVDLLLLNLLSREDSAQALKIKSDETIVSDYLACISNDVNRELASESDSVQHLLSYSIKTPFDLSTDHMLTREDFAQRELEVPTTTRSNVVTIARGGKCHKPVIYVYSEVDRASVRVNLAFDGVLTHLYPLPSLVHPNKSVSWDITTQKNGHITMDDSSYRYLFWEGDIQQQRLVHLLCQFSKHSAMLVSETTLVSYLEESLFAFGMIDHEIQDFITYWLPVLNQHKFNYIQFVDKAYTDAASLTTQPAYQNCLRVFMLFAGCDHPPAQLPEISSAKLEPLDTAFNRDGLTVVEWGGMNIRNLVFHTHW